MTRLNDVVNPNKLKDCEVNRRRTVGSDGRVWVSVNSNSNVTVTVNIPSKSKHWTHRHVTRLKFKSQQMNETEPELTLVTWSSYSCLSSPGSLTLGKHTETTHARTHTHARTDFIVN